MGKGLLFFAVSRRLILNYEVLFLKTFRNVCGERGKGVEGVGSLRQCFFFFLVKLFFGRENLGTFLRSRALFSRISWAKFPSSRALFDFHGHFFSNFFTGKKVSKGRKTVVLGGKKLVVFKILSDNCRATIYLFSKSQEKYTWVPRENPQGVEFLFHFTDAASPK